MDKKLEPKKVGTGKPAEDKYYIVNPGGTIHSCTREHAREHLNTVGWRKATPDQVAELERRQGKQTFEDPICAPWSPDLVEEPEP